MKFIFSILTIIFCSTSTLGQSSKIQLLHFDGYYETECYIERGDDEGSQDYLRFYANGKIIYVCTDCDGTINELKDWFNINAEQVSKGDYQTKGRRIFFSTKSKTGIIKHKGRIKKDGLIKLKWKSLINGSKGRSKYKFTPVADLT